MLFLVSACSFYLGAITATYLISYKILINKRLELGPASYREYGEIKNECLIGSLIWPKTIYQLYKQEITTF